MEQFSVINAWLILMFRFLFVILDFRSILRSMYKPNEDQKTWTTIRSGVWNLYHSFSDIYANIDTILKPMTMLLRVKGQGWKYKGVPVRWFVSDRGEPIFDTPWQHVKFCICNVFNIRSCVHCSLTLSLLFLFVRFRFFIIFPSSYSFVFNNSWKIRVGVCSCSSEHEQTPVFALYVFICDIFWDWQSHFPTFLYFA